MMSFMRVAFLSVAVWGRSSNVGLDSRPDVTTRQQHSGPPLPTQRQLDFMEMETVQFMHFNVVRSPLSRLRPM